MKKILKLIILKKKMVYKIIFNIINISFFFFPLCLSVPTANYRKGAIVGLPCGVVSFIFLFQIFYFLIKRIKRIKMVVVRSFAIIFFPPFSIVSRLA